MPIERDHHAEDHEPARIATRAEAVAVPDEPGEQQRERDEEQQAPRGRVGIDRQRPARHRRLRAGVDRRAHAREHEVDLAEDDPVGGADRIHHPRGPRDQLQRRGKDHERQRQQQPPLIREKARRPRAEPPGDADDGCAERERAVRPRVGRAERQHTPGHDQDRAREHRPADRVEGRPVPSAAIRVVGHQQGWAPDPAAGRRESSARADA